MYAYHKIIGVPIHAVNFSLSLTKDYKLNVRLVNYVA